MKRNILFAFWVYCLIFTTNSPMYAQVIQYQSVFGETNTSFNLYNFQLSHLFADSTYFVKDTLVNSMEYKKFDIVRRSRIMPEQNNRYLGMVLLRESEDRSKLYCLYPDSNSEELLMDLNLNLQDTFYYPFVVDSIFYDNANAKHIILSMHLPDDVHYDCFSWCCRNIEFIEGVGPTLFIYSSCLLCAHKDELSHYLIVHSWGISCTECFCEWRDPNISIDDLLAAKTNLKIYPNPAYTFIEVDLGENFMNYQVIFVYDLLGRSCLNSAVTQGKHRLDIQSLPAGNYIMQVIGKDKVPVYGKFSVTR